MTIERRFSVSGLFTKEELTMSSFDRLMRDEIHVVKSDGIRGPAIKASVSRKTITVFRTDISIEEGNMIERETSRGVTERYFVEEVEFQEKFKQIPAHYTLHVEKQTKSAQETEAPANSIS